jgi:hypothetical protein
MERGPGPFWTEANFAGFLNCEDENPGVARYGPPPQVILVDALKANVSDATYFLAGVELTAASGFVPSVLRSPSAAP